MSSRPFVMPPGSRSSGLRSNTSAAVKARADWVVTSSIALKVAEHLEEQGKKIIWGLIST